MTRARQTRKAGTATLELALAFLLLWSLFTGCFSLGYGIFIYESLASAVSGAARYASRVDFDTGHSFIAGVQNMAVYGSPNGGTAAIVPGLKTTNINVTWTTDTAGVPLTMTVAVTGYSFNAIFQTFTWSSKPSVT